MTRARLFAFGACLAAMTGWPIAAHLQAADYGQMGETFPIIETDLLTTIEAKLRALEASGGINLDTIRGFAETGANGCSIPRSSPKTTFMTPRAT